MIEEIELAVGKIEAFPAFIEGDRSYEERFYAFVCDCFEVDEQMLGKMPELLTYASVVNSILEAGFLTPFYKHLHIYINLKTKVE